MRKFALTLVLLEIALCRPVLAQNLPSGEVFGGYSYLNVDVQSGVASSTPIPRQNANGWEVAAAFNVNPWLAVEGDFGGYYKDVSLGTGVPDLKLHAYSYTGGPRFNYRARSATTFFHALLGGDNLSGSISGVGSASQNSLAVAIGGGVEWKIKPQSRWAIRGSADYVLTRHNIAHALGFSGPDLTQNNFRASVGVVYMFGGVRERAPRPIKDQPASKQCIGSAESALLGLTGCSNGDGFLVSSAREGSPGAVAAIRVGDVVTEIGDRPVHSARDIDAAIGSSSTVKISYLIKGSWLAVREIKLP
jgi:hypothetical protein